MVKYSCPICNKEFKQKQHYIEHTQYKKKPCIPNINNIKNPVQNPLVNTENKILLHNPKNLQENNFKNEIIVTNNLCCSYCKYIFKRKDALKRHINKSCKIKKLENEKNKKNEEITNYLLQIDELNQKFEKITQNTKDLYEINERLVKQNDELNNKVEIKLSIIEIFQKLSDLEKIIPENESKIVNNKLINIIIDKDKKINDLKNNYFDNNSNTIVKKQEISSKYSNNFIINNQIITHRDIDNYINATQLCKAGGKLFSNWISLENTKELINQLSINPNNEIHKVNVLIDIKKRQW